MTILPESKKPMQAWHVGIQSPLKKDDAPRDYERIIDHACRELKTSRKQIATRFQIPEKIIGPEEISKLWLEHLRRK